MRGGRLMMFATLLAAGCATSEPEGLLGRLWRLEVGPDYQRPAAQTPDDFRGRIGPADAASLADLPCWEVFGDPVLHGLVNSALVGNYDLQAAVRCTARPAFNRAIAAQIGDFEDAA
jgi:hypothetical protein